MHTGLQELGFDSISYKFTSKKWTIIKSKISFKDMQNYGIVRKARGDKAISVTEVGPTWFLRMY